MLSLRKQKLKSKDVSEPPLLPYALEHYRAPPRETKLRIPQPTLSFRLSLSKYREGFGQCEPRGAPNYPRSRTPKRLAASRGQCVLILSFDSFVYIRSLQVIIFGQHLRRSS